MKIIEVKDLSFQYKIKGVEVPIFDSFSLDIEQGDFIAIRGPSGSGKSTLLYLLAGLLKYDKGSIKIKGQEISQLTDLELSSLRNHYIGFVFQQFHLLPKLTVKDNISLPLLYPVEEKKSELVKEDNILELAQELGLQDRLGHFPNQLSGGQQQRVAIGRALINGAEIILADEPTGNLDSKTTDQIMELLKRLHAQGKTIILITHEEEVSRQASKVYFLRDGRLEDQKRLTSDNLAQDLSLQEVQESYKRRDYENSPFKILAKSIPEVIKGVFRHRFRSLLTMLGVVVGVAAVGSMVTLGEFIKERVLESYTELGVNTMIIRGYPNWNLKATDIFPVKFNFFSWEEEIVKLKKVFPEVQRVSPNMRSWNSSVSFGGRTIDQDVRVSGVAWDGLKILGRELLVGQGISPLHVERRSSVCVIGIDIGSQLFSTINPIGQVLHVSQNESTFACKIIGVLESKTSNKDWSKPNLQVFVPFTFFQSVSDQWWSSQIHEVTLQLWPGVDVQKVGEAIKNFFEMKYGVSGRFHVDSDSVLLAQMEKFLNLFSILLLVIALASLVVGGMGIANMMLVSVSERLKEIGIRKSIGATHVSVRNQFLLEALFLCTIAGVVGLLLGFVGYQLAIYSAAKLISKLQFQWVVEPYAIILSFVSIFLVGILSGLIPALKAEKLQVIEALRSE